MGVKMANRSAPAIDAATVLDLLLLQQAKTADVASRQGRRASRDRLQVLFQTLQMILRPEMTLEIGAFDARFSRQMATKGVRAYAFEANPYNYRKFSSQINKLNLPLSYLHLAMSDVDGEATFEVKTTINGQTVEPVSGNNSLLRRSADRGEIGYETVTVPSTTLAGFLKQEKLGDLNFSAWIDVEGALSKVLGGFGKAMKNCLSVIVELEELPYWNGQMLYDEAIRWFIGQGFLPVARDFESPHQFNVIFLKAELLREPKVRLALARHIGAAAGAEPVDE